MEEFANELFGDGFCEYPLLLRPLVGTVILVVWSVKFAFYFMLPALAAYAILLGATVLIVTSIVNLLEVKWRNRDEHGTQNNRDDDNWARGSFEHRLEAGEIEV
ncbi:hypothetical protein LT330_006159 [Penicillium expansum]|nr:hypothetical protein LT330_006159 [Penicillium expansum]